MISCMIEIADIATKPMQPSSFLELPRIGERIVLSTAGSEWEEYRVIDILHMPKGLQSDADQRPPGVLLKVRKIN